jgi:hypothetical protein
VDSSGNVIACLSSCSKFGGDQYCCTGSSDSASSCNPAAWPVNSASYFKSGCPDAYSYALDSVTSTFACQGASGYVITFLPFGGGAGQSSPAPDPSDPSTPAPDPSTPAPDPSTPAPDPSASATPAPAPSASPQPGGQPGQPGWGGWGWQKGG